MILRWLQIWSASQVVDETGDGRQGAIAQGMELGRGLLIPVLASRAIMQMIDQLEQ
jgi:hypothetical protein